MSPAPAVPAGDVGITVYGCEPDEADLFRRLSRRYGVTPTMTKSAVSPSSVISEPVNRCVSVGHKSEVAAPTLLALKEAGVTFISTRSIGCDHIDLDTSADLGITVANVVYPPDGVADFTVMLMLMAIRNAQAIVRAAAANDFRLHAVRGRELGEMTVGVVGTGRIGNAVINRLQGFGSRILTFGNRPAAQDAARSVSLDELLRQSDIVTLHLPSSIATHHVVGRRQLEAMKPGAYLINTGRGALVDTDALVTALESGRLGGAALDVLEGEEGLFYFDCNDKPIDNRFMLRLQKMPQVIITPHTAFHTGRVLFDTVERTLINCLTFERTRSHEETEGRHPVRRVLGRA